MQIKINYKPHYFQSLFHDSNARFRLIIAGRRFGKSLSGCAEAFKMAVSKPKQRGWIVSPYFKQSEEDFRILKEIVPSLAIAEIKLSDRRIVFRNGSEIEFKSADNEDSLRGAGLDFVLLDEAARIKEAAYLALRPALADKKGRGIFLTTPKGKNWIHSLFLKGKDPDEKDWESWRFSSKNSPYFSIDEYNELKKSLPADVFSQEIEAEFIDNASQVFRNIKDRINGDLEAPRPGETYSCGVDLAKISDFTAICILDSKKHLVYFDRFQRLDWHIQKQRILTIAKKYNNAAILLDSTGIGDPLLEDIQKINEASTYITREDHINVSGFKFTNLSKNQLISNLQLAFETEKISFPNIPVLIDEIEAYEYEILTSGNFRYGAPAGLHDDCVCALALSNFQADHPPYNPPQSYNVW